MGIKPSITADGFRTAVRDYTEPTVIEELAANSYDADATVVFVLLDTTHRHLYVIDDGCGFTREAIQEVATLGFGDKPDPFSKGGRPYLGSYGYGLKSSLNIATKVDIRTRSNNAEFEASIDWTRLDEALKPSFQGYKLSEKTLRGNVRTGTVIKLYLKNPTTKQDLDRFGEVLANLPNDNGRFRACFGLFSDAGREIMRASASFRSFGALAKRLLRNQKLMLAEMSRDRDLQQCITEELTDTVDRKVKAKIFFAGLSDGKVRGLKPGLRGIYVRIHGRLLKQSFTDRKYTYPISKWIQFESGLRVELTVDWLRDQISLSREGVRFSNEKLHDDFKTVLTRLISRFIQPLVKKLEKKKAIEANRKHKQRMILVSKRVKRQKGILIPGIDTGFSFQPETDAELALLLGQDKVLRKIDKHYELLDYNDQASFDCIIHDRSSRSFIFAELEPTLMELLDHKDRTQVELVVVWTRGKWRIGSRKQARNGWLELLGDDSNRDGHYKLLEYASSRSKTPSDDMHLVALDEILCVRNDR